MYSFALVFLISVQTFGGPRETKLEIRSGMLPYTLSISKNEVRFRDHQSAFRIRRNKCLDRHADYLWSVLNRSKFMRAPAAGNQIIGSWDGKSLVVSGSSRLGEVLRRLPAKFKDLHITYLTVCK